MPGYDSKKSKFGSRKPRNTDKLSKEEQKKIEERNKKRGLTKAQAQDVGLTGQKSRDAAVKLRANRATQKTAVAKEAKRRAAEKKKMKAVSNASLLAGGIGAGAGVAVGQKAAKLAAQKAAKAARLKEIDADILKIKDYPKRGKVRGMPQRALDTPAGKARQLKAYEEVRKRYLNKGGEVRKRTKENSFVKKLQEDMPLGIGKILTPIESSGIGGAYKKMTKKIVDKVAKKKAGKKTSNMQPLKKPSVKRLKESERAVPRAIGKGIDKVVGKRIPLKDLRKTDAQYRAGLKAGGLVKKKGIDGIAKRGKTRAARSR